MTYKYINTDYLETVTGGDKDIAAELVSIFRQQSSEFHIEMVRLNKEKKFAELGLLAHKAKSSVAIMGMEKMAIMLKEMETEARKGIDSDNYVMTIESFRQESEGALIELDNYISTL